MMLFENIKDRCLFDNKHNNSLWKYKIIKRKKFFVYENFVF